MRRARSSSRLPKRNIPLRPTRRSSSQWRPRRSPTVQVHPRSLSLLLPLRALQVRQGGAPMRSLPLQTRTHQGQQVPSRLQARATGSRPREEGAAQRRGEVVGRRGGQGREVGEGRQGRKILEGEIHRDRGEEPREEEFHHDGLRPQ